MGELESDTTIADALCDVIARSIPQAVRTTKWNAPNFQVSEHDLITLNFSPRHPVRVVFHRGAKAVDTKTGNRLVADDSQRLTWATDQRAYAAFADVAAVQDGSDWLTGFCQKWVTAALPDQAQDPTHISLAKQATSQ